MKKLRTLFALLLTVLLLCGTLATSALADTALTTEGTVTITNALAGTTYEFYRVFDISGIVGTKAAFITNATWHSVIADLNGGFGTVVDKTVTSGSPITPNENFNTSTRAQEFAVKAIAEGEKAGITPDKTFTVTGSTGSYDVDGLQYGYYIMVSSRKNSEGEQQYTVFTLMDSSTSVNEKNVAYPSIVKTVNDLNAVTADYNELLNYKIVIAAAAGDDTYTVTDVLPAGIDYIDSTLKVTKNGSTTPLTENTDYTVNVDDQTTGDTVTITLTSTLRDSLADGDEIVIEYQGKLQSGTDTVSGHRNTATLTYEVNKTKANYADVFTGLVSFYKRNSIGNAILSGAEFVIKNNDGKFAKLTHGTSTGTDNYAFDSWKDTQAEATVITTGTLQHMIRGLAAGEYTLVEINAPDGFVKGSDTVVKVVEITNLAGEITGTEMKDGTDTVTSYVTILNTPGSTLPDTGGSGTTAIYAVGAVLVVGALVLAGLKRRKNAAG